MRSFDAGVIIRLAEALQWQMSRRPEFLDFFWGVKNGTFQKHIVNTSQNESSAAEHILALRTSRLQIRKTTPPRNPNPTTPPPIWLLPQLHPHLPHARIRRPRRTLQISPNDAAHATLTSLPALPLLHLNRKRVIHRNLRISYRVSMLNFDWRFWLECGCACE